MSSAYRRLQQETGCELAPVGERWWAFHAQPPEIELKNTESVRRAFICISMPFSIGSVAFMVFFADQILCYSFHLFSGGNPACYHPTSCPCQRIRTAPSIHSPLPGCAASPSAFVVHVIYRMGLAPASLIHWISFCPHWSITDRSPL